MVCMQAFGRCKRVPQASLGLLCFDDTAAPGVDPHCAFSLDRSESGSRDLLESQQGDCSSNLRSHLGGQGFSTDWRYQIRTYPPASPYLIVIQDLPQRLRPATLLRRLPKALLAGVLYLLWSTASPGLPEAYASSKGSSVEVLEDKKDEYEVKATLLYHFLAFTTWPTVEEEGSDKKVLPPLEILVVGVDPFGDHLTSTFKGKKLGGRSVTLLYSKQIPKVLTADLVFAGGLTEKQRSELITLGSGNPSSW